MKVFVALVVSFQLADAAYFALTMHVAAAVAFNEVPLTEHDVPVTVKVTAPVPVPPVVVSAIAVPTVPVSVVFDTDSVDCLESPPCRGSLGNYCLSRPLHRTRGPWPRMK